jgi:hypothetical protein
MRVGSVGEVMKQGVKKVPAWIGNKIDQILLVIFGMAGGLTLGQFPQFFAQYMQRLGGHVDEARRVFEQYNIAKLGERVAELEKGLHAIENAPDLWRLKEFLANAQWDIVQGTLENYKPGITFTSEEIYYLITGALIGMIVYWIIKGLLVGLFRLFGGGKKKNGYVKVGG